MRPPRRLSQWRRRSGHPVGRGGGTRRRNTIARSAMTLAPGIPSAGSHSFICLRPCSAYDQLRPPACLLPPR
eukprot:2974771-Prymnesium_polylepis.1